MHKVPQFALLFVAALWCDCETCEKTLMFELSMKYDMCVLLIKEQFLWLKPKILTIKSTRSTQ